MTIKRLLPLLALVAIGALAAPVAAQAEEDPLWYIDEGEEETLAPNMEAEEELAAFPFEGTLSITVGFFKTGECTVKGEYEVGNDGMAAGNLNNVTFGAKCKTSIPGCETKGIQAQNLPWPYTVKRKGADSVVDFTNVTIKFEYEAACAGFGIPAQVPVAGTLTGKFVGNSAEFAANEGDLFVEGTNIPGQAEGKFSPGAKNLTLK